MKNNSKSLMVLVAGPYRSGTNDNPVLVAVNLADMNRAALQLFRAGHLPVLGEWSALPLIQTAGSKERDPAYDCCAPYKEKAGIKPAFFFVRAGRNRPHMF